jgi:hypothetical protein
LTVDETTTVTAIKKRALESMQNIHSKMRDEQTVKTHTNARAAPTLECARVQAFFQFKFTERSASQT